MLPHGPVVRLHRGVRTPQWPEPMERSPERARLKGVGIAPSLQRTFVCWFCTEPSSSGCLGLFR